jgi:hypothetical protein
LHRISRRRSVEWAPSKRIRDDRTRLEAASFPGCDGTSPTPSGSFAARPGFTAAAAGTLALGIGATSAIFSLVWAVILKPLPGVDPARTVAVEALYKGEPGGVSGGAFAEWKARATQFEHLAAVAATSFNLSEAGTPERIAAERVPADFFRVFRIAPRLGRTFADEEETRGRDQVVVLGEGLWRRRFGADPGVLGRSLRLGNETYTVVGVMPSGFDPLMGGAQMWVPLALHARATGEPRRALHAGLRDAPARGHARGRKSGDGAHRGGPGAGASAGTTRAGPRE